MLPISADVSDLKLCFQHYEQLLPDPATVYDAPQSRALVNSSSWNDSSLAASKCICTTRPRWNASNACFSFGCNQVPTHLLPVEDVDEFELPFEG